MADSFRRRHGEPRAPCPARARQLGLCLPHCLEVSHVSSWAPCGACVADLEPEAEGLEDEVEEEEEGEETPPPKPAAKKSGKKGGKKGGKKK